VSVPDPRPVRPFVVTPPSSHPDAVEAAFAAARWWGLPSPTHLRTGMNALFTAGDDVLLRVGHVGAAGSAAVELYDVLAENGIRTPRHLHRVPFEVGAYTVFAHRREHHTGVVDWCAVGEMVERLHRIAPDEIPSAYPQPWCGSFPWWDFPFMLDEVGGLIDDRALEAMRHTLAQDGRWPELVEDDVVCHGDLHPGNVVQTLDGPVLLDWDLLCRGPRAWDHSPLMTWTQRWGGAGGVYESFAAGYGRSLRGDRLAESLAKLRLLAATLMRVRAGQHSLDARQEAERRLGWWRGDSDAPWNAA
jgi:hypothetical protein